MKRLFGIFLLLLVTFNVFAIDINSTLSGVWYNPTQKGHGLNVVVMDENTTIVYWYVYHTDGTPMFLITVGQNQGNRVTGTTYYNTGMKFGEFDPNDIQETVWGTSTVTFSDCSNAALQYSFTDPAYGNGTIAMQRIASVEKSKCTDSPLHGTYFGAWENSGEIGYGLATLFEDGYMVFGAESDTSGEIGIGEWWVTGNNSFAFAVTSYSVFGGWVDLTGNGNFNEDALTARYSGNGSLAATPIPSFQYSLNTSKMAGAYNIHDSSGNIVGSAAIESNGNVSGSTSSGCNFVGTFFVPNTNFNQAYMELDVSSCGDTVSIIGSAVYNNPQSAIVIAAADGWYGYAWTLRLK
jgi:hypothetical protein